MPVGTKSWKGLAVPLYGESEIQQVTAGTDILTLTAISGATGDFLVARQDDGTELAVLDQSGFLNVVRMSFGVAAAPTTAPTTGLTKGEMLVVWSSATHPVLGMCVSTATQLVQYIAGFNAGTLGIAST